MAQANIQRRPAAILAADVAGYTKLMEADEDATMSTWWTYRAEIVDPLIAEHGGRIVKHTGDGFLAEFASVAAALRCALAMQDRVAARNEDAPLERRMTFRMGLNVGDIMSDDEDIYGDGVNLAARLESLAPEGGICVSGAVYDQVKGRVAARFEDAGLKRLKNVAQPVRVFRVSPGDRAATESTTVRRRAPSSTRRLVAWGMVAVVLGLVLFDLLAPSAETDDGPPTIGVLTFRSLDDRADHRVLSDGLAEDLRVGLSAISGLRVVVTQASGTDGADPRKASQTMGARYLLEGTVRAAGPTVRITTQLVDVEAGYHVWGGRYDRTAGDVLALQADVATAIVAALPAELAAAEAERREALPDGPVERLVSRLGDGLTALGSLLEGAVAMPLSLMGEPESEQ